MKALDLFCCAGGASDGLARAGFQVLGIDLEDQPEYPHTFFKSDALNVTVDFLRGFDLVWASPPCQAFTAYKRRAGHVKEALNQSRTLASYFEKLASLTSSRTSSVPRSRTRSPYAVRCSASTCSAIASSRPRSPSSRHHVTTRCGRLDSLAPPTELRTAVRRSRSASTGSPSRRSVEQWASTAPCRCTSSRKWCRRRTPNGSVYRHGCTS